MPHRSEPSTEVNAPIHETVEKTAPGERTRKMISKGLEEANNGSTENASRLLQYGLTALLQEQPIKFQDVKDAVNKIVGSGKRCSTYHSIPF